MRVGVLVFLMVLGVAHAADLSREIVYHIGSRQYAISNPQDAGSNLPLILYYHGINTPCTKVTGDIIDAANAQGFRALIGSVCGVNGAWDINGQGDIDYTHNVINDIASKYSINRQKVFLTGWSMGGMMCSRIACKDGGIAAGIAMVDCAFSCDNFAVKTNLFGIEAMYDSVCVNWVSPAYAQWAQAYGCPSAGSGDTRRQTCSGKYVDLDRKPAGHSYIDVPAQVAFFKKIADGSTPPPPSTGSTCASSSGENVAVTLGCDNGQVINSIDFASYGTPSGSCSGSFSKSSCDASTSASVLQAACVGHTSCSVTASNSVFGDPCSGVGKHLAARVSCAAGSASDNSCGIANEGKTLSLACGANKRFTKINFASYGTPTGSCQAPATSSCHASSSQAVVEAACLNKNSCSIAANNGVFGDPCSGGVKQLAVVATCA